MDKRKMNLDRDPISSEQIQAKQNFDAILSNYQLLKKPFFKSKWFWGATGLATLGLVTVFGLSNLNNNIAYAENTTLTNNQPLTSNLPEDTPCVLPVVENAVSYEVHNVMALEGATLKLKDGSIIKILPGSLIANDMQEPVKVKTRVFHDKASAFLAGVKMDVAEGAFESAGMIEIRTSQNNKEVKINPDKPIEVSLALHKPSESFNFYYLDEKKKEWIDSPCLFSDRVQKSPEENSGKFELVQSELSTIQKELTVNQSQQQELKIELPTKEAYKISENPDRIFDLDYDLSDYPELKRLKNVKFEALSNQKNFNRVINTTWSEMDLSTAGNDRFTLTFSNAKLKETIRVRPVLSGAEEQSASELFDKVKGDIDKQLIHLQSTERELKRKEAVKKKQLEKLVSDFELNTRLVMQENQSLSPNNSVQLSQATATFTTTRNGFFNADKPIKYPKPLPFQLAYVNNGNPFSPRNVYIFDQGKDVRYTYGIRNKSMNEIGLNDGEQLLIVIDAMNRVAFAKVNKKYLQQQNFGIINVTLIEQDNINEAYIRKLLNEQQAETLALR